jgi:PAS domain S-box-containing protein
MQIKGVSWRELARKAGLAALVAAAYFLSATLAYALSIDSLVLVWIPSGVILGVLVSLETRDWPAALLGAFAGNVLADLSVGLRLPLAALGPAANGLEAFVAAWVVRRLAGRTVTLTSLREVVVLILGAATVSNGVTTILGAVILHLWWTMPFANAWFTWWIGDGLGMLIVAPMILAFARVWRLPRRDWVPPGRLAEGAVLLTSLALVAHYVFSSSPDPEGIRALPRSPYLVFPFLFWGALRFGPTLAASSTVLLAAIVLWNAGLSLGPLVQPASPALQQAVGIYLFLAVAALATLVPAAIITEHRTATAELRKSQEQHRMVAEQFRALNAELEQRVAERTAALRASEEQFRTLAATAHDAIVTADHDGRITYFNPGAERMFRYARIEVLSAPLTVLMPERFHEPHRQGLARYLATGEARVVGRTVELVGRRKDGTEFPLELSLASRRHDTAPAFIGIIRDITERKEAEQVLRRYAGDLETANKELEAFSYSVSHDLRAPLRSIHGFSQAVLEDNRDRLDPQGIQHLGRVCAAAEHMGVLIDDLLELSRAVRADMRRERVDLSRLAKRIAAELAATDPGRRVEFRIADGLTCKGDQHLLALVLRNFLENAWKFTAKRDRAVVEVGVADADERPYFVRDNGAGFDMRYADKLFQPFQRLHAARDFAGTGIGLALVQRIIHRHSGRVWAEGAAGQGATFYFTLPDA